MSLIIHRCVCGHPDVFHRGGCEMPCLCNVVQPGPSEVIPTFNDGEPIDTVTEPGTALAPYGKLCGCDECVALYERLTS